MTLTYQQKNQKERFTLLAIVFAILSMILGAVAYRFTFGGLTGFSFIFENFNQDAWGAFAFFLFLPCAVIMVICFLKAVSLQEV